MGTGVSQMKFLFRTWGGKRKGAGRKLRAARRTTPHRKRPKHERRHPVLVTIRVADDIANLRHRRRELAFREAMITTARRENFRIVHFSIQRNHVHLLCEADDAHALSRGMQGFQISAARHLNRILGRKGQVFIGRYHARELTTPTQVRNALNYLFNNWRHHDADRHVRDRFDRFSDAQFFGGWQGEAPLVRVDELPADHVGLPTYLPKTWLLRVGWQKAGLLSPHDRPRAADGS